MQGIIHLIVHLVTKGILNKTRSPATVLQHASTGLIRLPKLYLWVGILCSLFFAALAVLSWAVPNGTGSWWTTLVFAAFTLLGLSIVVAYVNWRIELYGVYFVYRTFFGQQYEHVFSDIIRVSATENTIRVYTEKKCFYVDLHAVGIQSFLEKIPQTSGVCPM